MFMIQVYTNFNFDTWSWALVAMDVPDLKAGGKPRHLPAISWIGYRKCNAQLEYDDLGPGTEPATRRRVLIS